MKDLQSTYTRTTKVRYLEVQAEGYSVRSRVVDLSNTHKIHRLSSGKEGECNEVFVIFRLNRRKGTRSEYRVSFHYG